MQKEKAEQVFREKMREINHLTCLIEELMWDTRVNLPPNGAKYRSELMGYVTNQRYHLKTSDEMGELIGELKTYGTDDIVLKRMVEVASKEYERFKKVPADLEERYAKHGIMTELIWQDAKAGNDYEMIKPYLKASFDFKKEYADAFGLDDVMDYLVDNWEEGLTSKDVDKIFDDLKEYIIPTIAKIKNSGKDFSREKIQGVYPKEKQLALIKEAITKVGYNLNAGGLGESAHPFTLRVAPRNDMRFTVTYHENDFTKALISSMHECGHAMYGQNLSPKLDGTTLGWCTSWGFDEGQAKFYENFVGRSLPFWKLIYPSVVKNFPELSEMSVEEFYANMNAVSSSPYRLSADEMSFNLHIIFRYELEKMYFNGDADADTLPGLWMDKCEEYLGYRPKDNVEGILQDVHWFSGWIGYYQSYVIANCYDGHFLHGLKKAIPDFYSRVEKGEFEEITRWQNENVRQYGNLYSPRDTLYNFSQERLSAQHYIDYLKNKFEALYEL